ncbi:MAG: putative ABC transport system permease protein [Candidatus Azotimanducaceae bacterium]|jgi:putative ABC transport system permease protein
MLLFKLAFRNIFRQKRRSLLTGLSMAGGYILCALSFSTTEGSYNNVINLFTLDHSGHVQIHKGNYLQQPKTFTLIEHPEKISQTLDEHEKVVSHTLRVYAPVLAYSETGNSPAKLIGVDVGREKQTSRLYEKVKSGTYLSEKTDKNGYFPALIGKGISRSLSLSLGDELVLISQGADGSIANDIFIISGIVGNKDSMDKNNIFIPLQAAQYFLSMPNQIHEIAILLNSPNESRDVSINLQVLFPNLTVSPWEVVEETFYKSMQSDKAGNRVGLLIIIFIVFIGVLNTVLMSVLERTREFGVIKAIGTRPIIVAKLITLETTILATMSSLVGLVLSVPIIAWFTYVGIELKNPIDMGGILFSRMTGELSPYVFGMPMIIIIFSALVISIFPGIKAAKILPTEAMRSH